MDAILPKPRRRFRFSLRTMFVLVTVGCFFLAWLVYHLDWIRQRRDALESIVPALYFFVGFPRDGSDAEKAQYQQSFEAKSSYWLANENPPPLQSKVRAPMSIRLLGAVGVESIMLSSETPEAEAQRIAKLFPEAYLGFRDGRRLAK